MKQTIPSCGLFHTLEMWELPEFWSDPLSTAAEESPWNDQQEYCWGALTPLLVQDLTKLQIYVRSVCIGSSFSSVKHHSETHIIKITVIKHSKMLNGDLKPKQETQKQDHSIRIVFWSITVCNVSRML